MMSVRRISNVVLQFLSLCMWCLTTSAAFASKHIQVHLIPHSHVDPMWLFTSGEYIQRTQIILEKTILTLLLDEKKTFVWESIFFLDDFLTRQGSRSVCSPRSSIHMTAVNKKILKDKYNCFSFKESLLFLLEKQQLELVGGGWVSHDEALTDFSSALSSMTLGRSWIVESLGKE